MKYLRDFMCRWFGHTAVPGEWRQDLNFTVIRDWKCSRCGSGLGHEWGDRSVAEETYYG